MVTHGFARRVRVHQWNRFAALPRWAAISLLTVLIGLMAYGALGQTGNSHVRVANSTAMKANGLVGDHALYSEIVRRVGEGENYYHAATSEQRANRYPTQPFLTIRLPSYALLMAALGEKGTQYLAMAIALLATALWFHRLRTEPLAPRYAHLASVIILVNVMQPMLSRSWIYMHESITGALMALALAVYRKDNFWPAFIVMAITLALRETALPVAMIFGLFALWDRNGKAVAAWLALGTIYGGVMALHIQAINAEILPNDRSSPGWSAAGGWLTYASFIFKTSIFHKTAGWLGALLIPLALLGWASWKCRIGALCFAVQIFYALLFMIAARPDNFYWGLLMMPSLFIGLIFAPAALIALLQSSFPTRKAVMTSIA